jgi:hypothetical protein
MLDATPNIEQVQLLVLVNVFLFQGFIAVEGLVSTTESWIAALISECARGLLGRLPNRPIQRPGEDLGICLTGCEYFYGDFMWVMLF